MKDNLEVLANQQHDIWSHWMKYLFSVGTHNADGSYTISKENVDRWIKQCRTPYSELSESEKESDREQALKIMKVLKELGY